MQPVAHAGELSASTPRLMMNLSFAKTAVALDELADNAGLLS